jgi:hypothetical protein
MFLSRPYHVVLHYHMTLQLGGFETICNDLGKALATFSLLL